jgi:tagatose-1,6-bisphosphate aldolase
VASAGGQICLLALDHRDAMRNAFKRAGVPDVSMATTLEIKTRIAQAMASYASGILLDPAAVDRCRPAGLGLLVPLEEQGYEAYAGGRLSTLTMDFGPAEAVALGADGCKLLFYYRSDHHETAWRQRQLLSETVRECHQHGLPVVAEPLLYRLENEDEAAYHAAFGELVLAATRDLAGSGADLLKLPLPGDRAACERVTEAAGSMPWVLLGGSETGGKAFAAQLATACRGGASGFIAGRPIWGGVLGLSEPRWHEWLAGEPAELFKRLTEISQELGRSIR